MHEAADCSGDGMGTKGHFNPEGTPHGRHGGHTHHAGDLPSLKADANGVAEFNFMAPKLTVAAGLVDQCSIRVSSPSNVGNS